MFYSSTINKERTKKLIGPFYHHYLFSVYDLAFKPDGSQLIVAAGLRVLVRLFSDRHVT